MNSPISTQKVKGITAVGIDNHGDPLYITEKKPKKAMLFSENQTKDIKPVDVYVYVDVYVLNNYSGDGGVEEVHAHDASHPPLELTGGFDCIK